MNRAICVRFLSVIIIAVVSCSPGRAQSTPRYVAYSFYGPGVIVPSNDVPSGKTFGGYYLFNADALPFVRTYERTPFSSVASDASYALSGGMAVDDSLSDTTSPQYLSGGSAYFQEFFGDPVSHGYFRFSSSGYHGIFAHGTPAITSGTTLGSAIAGAGGFYAVIGAPGGARGSGTYGPAVSQFTAADIFNNEKSFQTPLTGGPTAQALFTPHVRIGDFDVPVALADVARLFGVDHFNWVNTVQLPLAWDIAIAFDDGTGFPISSPVIDPVPYSDADYVLENNQGTRPVRIRTGFDTSGMFSVADDHLFYFNEGTGGFGDVQTHTFTNRLNFIDSPGLPQEFLTPFNFPLEFRTELVGVYRDQFGSWIEKPTDLGFTWKSNTAIAGDVGYFSNLHASNLGTILSGGVYDLQIFRPLTIPEPSPLVLIAAAGMMLPRQRFRASKKRVRAQRQKGCQECQEPCLLLEAGSETTCDSYPKGN
jgi:hypothetical protein